jgi:hypothetical protein
MIVSWAIIFAKIVGVLVILVLSCLVYGYLKDRGKSN